MSETAKYRHLVVDYCAGCGADVGCGHDKVVPEAIGVDLCPAEYERYRSEAHRTTAASLMVSDHRLPFLDGSLDYLYSSHLLEDFADWRPVLIEWLRVLRPGGNLLVIIPDKERFAAAVARGQPPNLNHKHEGRVGELTEHLTMLGGCRVLVDRMTNLNDDDYSIVCIAKKA